MDFFFKFKLGLSFTPRAITQGPSETRRAGTLEGKHGRSPCCKKVTLEEGNIRQMELFETLQFIAVSIRTKKCLRSCVTGYQGDGYLTVYPGDIIDVVQPATR